MCRGHVDSGATLFFWVGPRMGDGRVSQQEGHGAEDRGSGHLAVLELVCAALGVGATLGDAKLRAAELFPWVYCTRNISPVTPANVWMKEEHGYRKIIAV